MRRLVNSTYVSLDGVIENPQNWPATGGFSDEGNTVQAELLNSCDAVVMGRRTYEGFAPVWPTLSGDPVGDRMNALPKYVASTTLRDPEWQNTTVLEGDPVQRIAELKEQDGLGIVQYGFGRLTYGLMAAGLLDELHLWVHPFFVGRASTDDLLFRPGDPVLFEPTDTQALSSGIVILRYRKRA
jgi:dihydrofolate reductase